MMSMDNITGVTGNPIQDGLTRAGWVAGRIIGAVRVLLGKSASIPKGDHDTAIGKVHISDYYGGCTFSIQKPDERDLEILRRFGRDLYWTSQGYDGSGTCVKG